jgi:hypothetical protein
MNPTQVATYVYIRSSHLMAGVGAMLSISLPAL